MHMLHGLAQILRENPAILLFAAIAAGYALGKLKVGTFSLGSTTGVLLAGIVIGAVLLKDTVYDLGIIKSVSFALFIFTIGFRVGPDFAGGLKRGGVKYVTVAVFFAVSAIASAIVLVKLFHLNSGYGAGMMGGALTQSSIIGTADGAIVQLESGTPSMALDLKSDVAVAYAITYLFGTAGLIVLLKILPRLWKINLRREALKEEYEMGVSTGEETPEFFQWANLVTPGAFRLSSEEATPAEIEIQFTRMAAVEMVHRAGVLIPELSKDTILKQGDIVTVTGYSEDLIKAETVVGERVVNPDTGKMTGEILGICLTRKRYSGKSLQNALAGAGHGCFVSAVERQGHSLPLKPGLAVHTGDVIRVMGTRKNVDRLAAELGYPERSTPATDLVAVGLGIISGTLLGLLSVKIFGIPLTLGAGGGVLVSGLFFGWLRSRKPVWGRIPGPAQWIFTDLGLNLFIACVGISAGPRAFAAIEQAGINIFLAGALLTVIPHVLTWIFGLHGLKLNPVLLLGALTGSGTCTAALNSVKDDCGSNLPVIGYTVPYAIGNVLLTVMGALIVNLI